MRIRFRKTGTIPPPEGQPGPARPVIIMTVVGTKEELDGLARIVPPMGEPQPDIGLGEFNADWAWVQGSPLIGMARWLAKPASRFMVKTVTEHYLRQRGG